MYKIILLSFFSAFVFMQSSHLSGSVNLINRKYLYPIDTLSNIDTLHKIDSAEILKKNIEEGEVLYKNKCSRCHALHDAAEYSAAEWKNILKVMSVKAELKSTESAKIRIFLLKNKNN